MKEGDILLLAVGDNDPSCLVALVVSDYYQKVDNVHILVQAAHIHPVPFLIQYKKLYYLICMVIYCSTYTE